MGVFYDVFPKLPTLFIIYAVLVNFCSARESVWGLKLTQASCMCHAQLPVVVGKMQNCRMRKVKCGIKNAK